MSENKFTGLSWFNRLQCKRIDYFRKIMVFIQMCTMLAFTLITYPGAGNFTQSIYIISFNAQLFFYFTTHILRPRLSSESTGFQLKLFTGQSGIFNRIRQIKRIRRRTTQQSRAKVMHQSNLFFCITT